MKIKEFLKDMIRRYSQHEISQTGGEIAYFGFLSLFPFIVYINFIITLLHFSSGELIGFFSSVLPEEVTDIITAYIDYISGENSAGILSIGILATIYSASKVIHAMEQAVGKAYGIKKRKTFLKNLLFSAISVMCIGLFIAATCMIVVLGREPVELLLEAFGVQNLTLSVMIFKWIVVALIMVAVFWVIYYLMPDKKVAFKSVLPGTVFAAAGVGVLSSALGLYVKFAASAANLYGYIGAIFVALIWMYFVGVIFALETRISAQIERKRTAG